MKILLIGGPNAGERYEWPNDATELHTIYRVPPQALGGVSGLRFTEIEQPARETYYPLQINWDSQEYFVFMHMSVTDPIAELIRGYSK